MNAKEADQLKPGDKVVAFNGPYDQNATVVSVRKDHRNIRWIKYTWVNPKGKEMSYEKRHMSVYFASV